MISVNFIWKIYLFLTLINFAAYIKKHDVRVVLGISLGLKQHTKGYQFLNLQNHKVDISCNVLFHENILSYDSSANKNVFLSLSIPHNYSHDYDYINFPNNLVPMLTTSDTSISNKTTTNTNSITNINNVVESNLTNTSTDNASTLDEHNVTIRHSTRSKCAPKYLIDFKPHTIVRYPIILISFPITIFFFMPFFYYTNELLLY